jgi:hypothetical protein
MKRWVIFVGKGFFGMFVFLSCFTPEQVEAPIVPPMVEERKSSGCRLTKFWKEGGSEGQKIIVQLRYADNDAAPVLLDIIADNRVVRGYECQSGGPHEIRIPIFSSTWMMGYADLDQDGPSQSDPQGRTSIVREEQEEVVLQMVPGQVIKEALGILPPRPQ